MKIGLINPGYKYSAVNSEVLHMGGVSYVGASLKRAGHEVVNVDFRHDPNASLSQVADCEMVGVSTFVNGYNFLKETLPQLKGKKVIAGGPLISSYGVGADNLVMREFPEIDYGFIGESELSILELVDHLKGKRQIPEGVLARKNNEITPTVLRSRMASLDEVADVDYNDWTAFTKEVKGRDFNVLMARGCYNRCSYCFHTYNNIRSFSLPRIESQLEHIASFKPRLISFGDEVFTFNRERATGIAKIMKRLGIPYRISARATDSDPALLNMLADSGCTEIFLGVESGDQQILDAAGRNMQLDDVRKAIKASQEAHIFTGGFVLLGLPGETKETLEKTYRFIAETKVLPRARVLIPLPGTRIYKQALAQGKISELNFLKECAKSENFDTVYGDWVPVNMTNGVTNQELIDARNKINTLRLELEKGELK